MADIDHISDANLFRAGLVPLSEWLDEPPPPPDWILPGFLAGTIGALVSPGGTGKSMLLLQLALQLAAQVAAEDAPDLVGLGKLTPGKVLVVSAEDQRSELRRRLHTIARLLGPEARDRLRGNLQLTALVGRAPNLLDPAHAAALTEVSRGQRLVIIDTLRRLHLDDENDAGAMSRVLAVVEGVADQTGAGILLVHHTSKSAATNSTLDSAQASRGSSVLVDHVRWQAYLAPIDDDAAERCGIGAEERGSWVRLGTAKTNYGPRIAERWYRRSDDGVLIPSAPPQPTARPRRHYATSI